MAILLVLVVVVLALARPEALSEWFTEFDPKTRPGFVLIAIAALCSEYAVFRLRAGVKRLRVSTFLKWFGLNALGAALWGLPVAAVLYSGLLDAVRLYQLTIALILYELILVSLTTGWLWSRSRQGRPSQGFKIFIWVNLASMGASILTGYGWHYLYDWLEMKGVVGEIIDKIRSLRD